MWADASAGTRNRGRQLNAAPSVNRSPYRVTSNLMNKAVLKNIGIIAVVSILAVALFSRFAPASLQNLLTGAAAPSPGN